MLHAAVLSPLLALAGLVFLSACTSTPAEPTGEAIYLRYCASCHGTSGRGDGPVASSMTPRPYDLTTIAERSDGHFDERGVMAVIDGERWVSAHGSRAMPVWGAVFDAELEDSPFAMRVRLLRAQLLADYLRTIQR